MSVDEHVTAAVQAGGVTTLDERGLMPLADARALLAATGSFAKGEGGEGGVLASDRVWAALLSLDDGAELVAAARRLRWEFHPRGMDNIDLHRRYGDAIVPWLATFLDGAGVLHNQPWCVVPCLLACGDAAAFELVWRVRAVDGWGRSLVHEWLARHADEGARGLARRASDGDATAEERERALRILRGMSLRAPARVQSVVHGDDNLARSLGLVAPLVAPAVLSLLDACADGLVHAQLRLWPRLDARDAAQTFHGLRLVAARAGDADWGVALARLEGASPTGSHPAHVALYAIGSRVRGGARVTSRPIPTTLPATDFVAAIRDLAARDADAAWGTAASLVEPLALGPAARVLVDTTRFHHVVGPPRADEEPRGWHVLPSQSACYRSLAEAIASDDATRFSPGLSTVDPR